jgi:hypothetical protein
MGSLRRVLPALALAVFLPATAPAQVPAGAEFRVNTTTLGRQFSNLGSSAMSRRGDFVVVWDDGHVGSDVFAQRYDARGGAVGAEFRVNAATNSTQESGLVAMAPAGDFVVVWSSLYSVASQYDVRGQRFDARGDRIGTEFAVNASLAGGQFARGVAISDTGRFVVTWNGDDGGLFGVFARLFDRDGTPIGLDFAVNVYTTGAQDRASPAMDAAGNFVIVWDSRFQDGSEYGVFGRRFDAAGAGIGGEFRVNLTTAGNQKGPAVDMAADGSFVVAWTSYGQDGSAGGVFGRRYDPAGAPVGGELQLNTYTTGDQAGPTLDADEQGGFVVTWASIQDGDRAGIVARRYRAQTGFEPEFLVNTYSTDRQVASTVRADPVGNFVIAWDSYLQDGSEWGVYAQRFGGLVPAALDVDTAGNRVLEPGEAVDVRPAWRNTSGAFLTFSGRVSAFSGPPGATYSIADADGDYGTLADGSAAACTDCYAVAVINVGTPARPALHWDAVLGEAILPDTLGQQEEWRLHIGRSFDDVPATSGFYRFIETLLHHDVTGGCTATQYCPPSPTSREQMAVFVLVAKEGSSYLPPACTTPVYTDVPASSPFCRWIEELTRRGVVAGCGGGSYCPTAPVSREQMAVFVLLTLDPAMSPPPCAPPNLYADVPETSPFCAWIEELTNRNVVTGCGGGNYCPALPVSREQMAVFISATFGLVLYGP